MSVKSSRNEPVPVAPTLAPLSPPRRMNSKIPSGQRSPVQNKNGSLSRRPMSVDTGAYVRSFSSTPQKETVAGGARSQSMADGGMNRLAFENIDLINTPLSSLRSCSEYNKGQPPSRENSADTPKAKSLFQSLFSWGGKKADKKKKNKVRFRDSKEDQVFMIENMRFNEANLVEGEDYNYRSINGRSKSRDEEIQGLGTYSIHSKADSYGSSSSGNGASGPPSASSKRKKAGNSFLRETSAAFDYVFGYGPRNKNLPMEIELRDLKAPQLLHVYPYDELEDEERLSNAHLLQEEALGILGIRRVTSLGSFQRVRADSTDSSVRTSIMSHSSAHSAGFLFVTFDLYDPKTWVPWARDRLIVRMAEFRHFYSLHLRSSNDELFYECIRIQPFAAGSYLRGMLSAGFCSMTFNIYNIMSWPAVTELTVYDHVFEYTLYAFVLAQLVLNLAQLPFRLQINSFCWDSSRVVEVDEAINFLRTMLHSDAWILNRSLGLVLDAFNIGMLVLCEVFLWTSSPNDALRPQVVSLCATSLLTILIRVVVATVFGLSMHDPDVLSNARRRGLSKWDLDVLPSFVYSCAEDVNNGDCSICLGGFELGEMLTCLPCDKKHSFHAGCIRSWLERQNSCPLCQRMV